VLEIEGLPDLKVEQAFELSDASAERSAAGCTVHLSKEPIIEYVNSNITLMRWMIAPDFRSVRLGTYSALSFWTVALLFASEHGSYWDVGLMAGIIFNWWMIRTKSLGDLILAHAVANACLCAYVVAAGKWEYWL